uniref:7-dehydrocholesterol reductase n=1 Tax=Heterosigma akashiwo TaxID=2829 RepID=A0A6V1WQP4_HETAK|mmetsp:Transcript_13498/g.18663  ORF Transcript_13498/g.18663 Transcript_13498/m.18663 type:complete len:444 (+) Transcript_13498:26-1357(+)
MAEEQRPSTSWGEGGLFASRTLGGLALLVGIPPAIMMMWFTNSELGGSWYTLFEKFGAEGFISVMKEMYRTPFDPLAWKIILGFMAFELALMKLVPGKEFRATVTKTGHVPVYTANGMQCYVLTLATFSALTYLGALDPAVVYDRFGHLTAAMLLFALLFCAMLYLKGWYAPSTRDSGSNGSLIMDYFWGMELYPRILGWDVKMFTNCRFGMMLWALLPMCFAYKQYQDLGGQVSNSMAINVVLQLIYVTKFFWWETGYLCSMDIQHDRAGYYICFGCLVYLPVMYTSHSFYLVKHAIQLTPVLALAIFLGGVWCIWANYDADRQRQEFRATGGRAKVWGKEPKKVVARYQTEDGAERESLLLCAGWWALSRHFHYVPEIGASLFWSLPALFGHFMPYFYVVYLSILLADRAWRDDARCAKKYGKYWEEYSREVPYKIIPGII